MGTSGQVKRMIQGCIAVGLGIFGGLAGATVVVNSA